MAMTWEEAKARLERAAPAFDAATPRLAADIRAALQRVAELERERDDHAKSISVRDAKLVAAEAEVARLRAALDQADCTQREGGDARHCAPERLCWRCRAERDAAEVKRLEGLIATWLSTDQTEAYAAGLGLVAEAERIREREGRCREKDLQVLSDAADDLAAIEREARNG